MTPRRPEVLLRVEAPHFVAGAVFQQRGRMADNLVAVRAAPILRWALGLHVLRFCAYCRRKRWGISQVNQEVAVPDGWPEMKPKEINDLPADKVV